MTATAQNLFQDIVVEVPPTEGIKYAGSKLKLLSPILGLISKVKPKTVIDGFSGSTRVSQALAQSGYAVRANDISVWSEVMGHCYLLNTFPGDHYKEIIKHLNNLPPTDGWFTQNYGGETNSNCSVGTDGLKKIWQSHNTRRLDSIRDEVDRLNLSFTEKAVILTSLIRALDEVDSTLGHHASYLNDWSARSYKTLSMKLPALLDNVPGKHVVERSDIFDFINKNEVDLAYFDPPYGSNNEKMPPSRVRYSAYYHLWTTVCLNDKPALFGKAKRRADTSDKVTSSVFEEFRQDENGHFIAVKAIEKLINTTKANFILLSYSSGGRATAEELNSVISQNCRLLEVLEFDYRKNVMASMSWTNDWIRDAETPNKEFLFLMEKR